MGKIEKTDLVCPIEDIQAIRVEIKDSHTYVSHFKSNSTCGIKELYESSGRKRLSAEWHVSKVLD